MAGRLPLRFNFDLRLITTTQIHSAVRILAAVEFDMQFEILELLVVDEFRPIAGTDQSSVLHRPVRRPGLALLPARQILAIEELYGFAPFRRAGALQQRRFDGSPFPCFPVWSVHRARQLSSAQLSLEDEIAGAPLFVLGRDKRDAAVRHFDLWKRARIPPPSSKLRLQLTLFFLDFEPGWMFAIGSLESDIPASEEWLCIIGSLRAG